MAITSDIYGIANHVNELKKDYFPSNEDSLMIGTLGYIGELFINQWQDNILSAAQYSNEAIPTRAKFKRSIITHALSLDNIDITATPAYLDAQLFLLQSDIDDNLNINNQFILDSSQPIYIGDYEFHFDYDIIITRVKIKNEYVYTARYKDIGTNPISDLTDPYLKPPVVSYNADGLPTIIILCTLRQAAYTTISKKIISNSVIENKTFSFEFENQLAAFNIDVTDGDTTKRLTPVYINMYDGTISNYFYYEYLDDKTIRVKFDSESYIPHLNTLVNVNVVTTNGAAGNFKYKDMVTTILNSSTYGYSNVVSIIKPANEMTHGGIDCKTIKELKMVIPKEAMSRGNIATETDLNNYFNIINTADSKLYFHKKRYNQFSLQFYSHFVFRDDKSNILPTNTITLGVSTKEFDSTDHGKCIINPGTIIKYTRGERVGHLISKEQYLEDISNDSKDFYYTVPFSTVINNNPLYISYYLNIINDDKLLEFTWVNQSSELQFICADVLWTREYSDEIEDRCKYILSIDMTQNILADQGVATKSEEGEIIAEKLRAFVVFYSDEGTPYRYRELELTDYDEANFIYTFSADFSTLVHMDDGSIATDIMTEDDKLYVYGMTETTVDPSEISGFGTFAANCKAAIYIATKYDDGSHGLGNLGNIVPGMDDWTICNQYTVSDGLNFFHSYSDIISSVVKVSETGETGNTLYTMKQVPVIGYHYLKDLVNLYAFIEQLELRREYIASCLNRLDGPMGIDFKFYNTYGPSETYYIEDELIDQVNISLKFRTKILAGSDKYIKDYIIQDIKEYIENIETIHDLHMPNITTLIEQKYADQVQYFQFVGINDYPTDVQHIVRMDTLEIEEDEHVPELLNVDVNEDNSPRIELIIDT